MNKTEKGNVIAELKEKFSSAEYFYVADSSSLTVEKINNLRRICYEKGIEMRVAKNTLIIKALEQVEGKEYDEALINELKGPTTLIFSEVANEPARLIKDFRGEDEKPLLKVAYIDSEVFVGDEHLEMLSNLKSKSELIGEIIGLLQSPAKNLVSALTAPGKNLSAILQTLAEKGE